MHAAMQRPPPLCAPPVGARGKTMGEVDVWGRVVRAGTQTMKNRPPASPALGGLGRSDPMNGLMPAHHKALQNMAEQLAPVSSALAGGPVQVLKDRYAKRRKVNDQKAQEEVFEKSKDFLMEPERWTFGHMAGYQRKVLELAGATGWRRRVSADDPSILHLEKELKVLEAMTPVELASNHKSVFTKEAKKLIAEKAACTVKYVDQVIMEHDILRADRRWYQIRMQFNKPLPKTFEDRQFMGEYDRPFSQAEKDYQEMLFEEQKMKMRRDKPPRLTNIWFRQPTCGGNRWSTRPPRWYPSTWAMRPERKRRLAGAGVKGGGGDRGQPWGRLGKFSGAGGSHQLARR